MRGAIGSTWHQHYAGLENWVHSPKGHMAFLSLQAEAPVLRRFPDARTLLACLGRREEPGRSKDAVLASLARCTRKGRGRRTALALMWLAMRPALNRIYRRYRRQFPTPDELAAGICLAFLDLLKRIDHWRVNRVAATLARSTERDLLDAWRRERFEPVPEPKKEEEDEHLTPVPEPKEAEEALLTPAYVPSGPVLRWMDSLVGNDATLLFAVVVEGYDIAEVAVAFRLSPSAARKRLHRAKRLLRRACRPIASNSIEDVSDAA